MRKMLIIMIVLFCLFFSLGGMELKPLRVVKLTHDDETFIKRPGSFITTIDGMFIVLDSKASNIKIYSADGKLVEVFGRKGMGPNEFLKPYLSSYLEPYVLIGDYWRKACFIYKRTSNGSLKFIRKFLTLDMGNSFHLIDDNRIMVAGYKLARDRKAYHLYEYDFINHQYEFILQSEITYGFKSYKQYRKEYDEILCYIGLVQYIDFTNDSLYLVWEGDIKILMLDRKTKKHTFFGKKTGNYVQPYVTPEIRQAYNKRNHRLLYKIEQDMSYVRDIFVLASGKVGLVYLGPYKKDTGMRVMLQLYSSNGEFLEEFKVMDAKSFYHYDLFSYFRKDKNLLYILDVETSEKFDQFHTIHQFRIEE